MNRSPPSTGSARQRNAEFVFLFTAEEPLRDYTPIRIEGELHYTDGTPAKGIAVYAGAPFTQPLSQEEMEQSGGRTDSEGRFSIEGPQQGILAYSGSDRMAPDCTPIQATVPTPTRYPLGSTHPKPKAGTHWPAPPTWYGPR